MEFELHNKTIVGNKIKIYEGDCMKRFKDISDKSCDIIVTSPPYNLNIKYNKYKDNLKRVDYLTWLEGVFIEIKRIMKDEGSFFLNIGSSNRDPWIYMDVANVARKHFILQNDITWVKSISIKDLTYGHFKPINSERFMNNTFEHIFHFTKSGDVRLQRKANGVPYTDKSNIKRWKNKSDKRCRGNSWFIEYDTIQNKSERGNHPATFPEKLVKWCIKLHGYTENTVVCDPFSGTGTTLKVAKDMNVFGLGIELDKNYVDYINKRLVL